MKKNLFTLLTGIILFAGNSRADEGMWMLSLLEKLNYSTMQGMGLQLSPEEIYSINHSSIKDAIVIFDRGCTGEIISADGLLITNHHCGYDQIQNHSTVEHDYLKDGFWALKRSDELPNPEATVTFLISIAEVTESVLQSVDINTPEHIRHMRVDSIAEVLENKAVEGTHYVAQVRSFFNDNRYFLFVYEKFLDVRLVGAPPSSIGNFGDETDNWVWPRHTADFSMFRVYTGPDGKPAKYSPENIPLKSKYHLPVSLKGIEKGDFTMIMGYPGATNRYISSWGVQELYDVINPNRIKIRGIRQEILKEDMSTSDSIRIKYATKYARSSNYWKYSIGQNKGIMQLDVIDKKKAEEERFENWANSSVEHKEKYGDVLSDIEKFYLERKLHIGNRQLLNEVFRSTEIVVIASNANELALMLKAEPADKNLLNQQIENLKAFALDFYYEYNLATDIKVSRALMETYYGMVSADQRPDFYTLVETKFKGDFDKFITTLYEKSIFASQEKFLKFLEKPNYKTLSADLAFIIAQSTDKKRSEEATFLNSATESFNRATRLYTKGTLEMDSNKVFYPDANSTMRLTYGTVGDYSPADGVYYSYYTTMAGVIEKESTTNPEFFVPEKLKELYFAKDFGQYTTKDYMPVCFTTNSDITGGNSGSPVLNAKGELIGLAFDGNWEAMSGDIIFEKEIQKCICADIRYILFVIDKFAGAGHLVEEMTIVD